MTKTVQEREDGETTEILQGSATENCELEQRIRQYAVLDSLC